MGEKDTRSGVAAFLRKRAMVYLWRAQQSGAMISITLLGTLTAASIYSDFLRDFYENLGWHQTNVLPGLVFTMMMIFVGVFGVGYAFDRLKFWKEQNIVAIERNPYGSYKLTAKEIYWIKLWTATLAAQDKTDKENSILVLFEQWVRRSVEDDPVLRQEVEGIEKWITSGDESIKKVIEDLS